MVPVEVLVCQGLLSIFRDQKFAILVGNLDIDPLELGVNEWEDECILSRQQIPGDQTIIAYPKFVTILANHDTLTLGVIEVVSRRGDVDEEAILHVNPSGIHDVEGIRLAPGRVMRVDVEKEGSAFRDGRVLVIVGGHVVVCRQVVHARLGDHHVGIVIPRESLLVPPPAEQAAMHDPRLDAQVSERCEIRLDENPNGSFLLRFLKRVVCETTIVMLIETGLMEVFAGLQPELVDVLRCPRCFAVCSSYAPCQPYCQCRKKTI